MPGAIRVESTRGRLGDGEVRLDALVDPSGGEYEVAIEMADAPLDALTVETEIEGTPEEPDRLPGRLSARVLVRGDPDDPSTRVGHGRVELRESRLADGGTLALLQLGQLMPPIADELATGEAAITADRSAADTGPSCDDGGRISVRSTIPGAPLSPRKEVTASPVPTSRIAASVEKCGLSR